MLSQKVMEYVDDVMSRIAAPKELKSKLENELIRHVMESSVRMDIDEITRKLGSPEKIANEMSQKLVDGMSRELDRIFTEADEQDIPLAKISGRSCSRYEPMPDYDRYIPQRRIGEYTREESNTNIKLLYIPLIQISSGVEKLHLYLYDYDDIF